MAVPCNLTMEDNVTSSTRPQESSAEELVKFLIFDIAVPFMCCLGLLGNLLSLVVLATERLHRTLTKMEISAHIGLIALAVSDFLFCLLVLVDSQVTRKGFYEADDSLLYFDLMANGLITIFIIASTWLIVVMAAERYIAVCHPLRARKLISLRRTRVVTFLVFLLCTLATVPIFLERTIVDVVCDDGRVVYQLRQRSEQSVNIRRILWAVFFDFIPCIALIYFNTCLIVQIRKAKRLREDMTQKQSTTRLTTCKRKNHDYEVSLMAGEQQTNNRCSHALLRPENGSCRKQTDTSYVEDNFKGKQPKNNEERSVDARHWTNGHGAETLRGNNNSPRSSWSGERSGHSPRMTSRTVDSQCNEASKLNHGEGNVVRRTVKTSTIKKRPSDGALNSVTATLVAVVILFLILVSPCEILKFSLSFASTGGSRIVTYITNFMQATNFSLNFLLYCAVNKTFRYTLKRLALSCWYSIRGRC